METHFDARLLLLERFKSIRSKNRAFSLRSFARQLQISPASLSQIFSGKRQVTLTTAKKICDRLNLSPLEEQKILAGLMNSLPNLLKAKSHRQGVDLEADRFSVIADWYHFAILSLTEVKNSQPEPRWIAQRLGIQVREAKAAMDRLLRLNLLERVGKGWRQ